MVNSISLNPSLSGVCSYHAWISTDCSVWPPGYFLEILSQAAWTASLQSFCIILVKTFSILTLSSCKTQRCFCWVLISIPPPNTHHHLSSIEVTTRGLYSQTHLVSSQLVYQGCTLKNTHKLFKKRRQKFLSDISCKYLSIGQSYLELF